MGTTTVTTTTTAPGRFPHVTPTGDERVGTGSVDTLKGVDARAGLADTATGERDTWTIMEPRWTSTDDQCIPYNPRHHHLTTLRLFFLPRNWPNEKRHSALSFIQDVAAGYDSGFGVAMPHDTELGLWHNGYGSDE